MGLSIWTLLIMVFAAAIALKIVITTVSNLFWVGNKAIEKIKVPPLDMSVTMPASTKPPPAPKAQASPLSKNYGM